MLILYENMCVNHKQELSHRKQIARQLRTGYVEGIYRFKCTLGVTNGVTDMVPSNGTIK